jgi:ankyrin repeat protein
LRGEITIEKKEFFSLHTNNFINSLLDIMNIGDTDMKENDKIFNTIFPTIINELVSRVNSYLIKGEINFLLKMKNEIKHIPYSSYTKTGPLHIAAINGDIDIVSFLLKCNININLLDSEQVTPLYYAAINKHEKVATLLKEHGGIIEYKDLGSLMCSLAANKDLATIKLFHNCGADIMSPDYNSRTLAHIAAAEGEKDIIEFLINTGYKIIKQDKWGKTPFDDCPEDIRELILSKFPEAAKKRIKKLRTK